MAALQATVRRDCPDAKRVGVLTSSYVRDKALFAQAFDGSWDLIYPDESAPAGWMDVVYADDGINTGQSSANVLNRLKAVCDGLLGSGVT